MFPVSGLFKLKFELSLGLAGRVGLIGSGSSHTLSDRVLRGDKLDNMLRLRQNKCPMKFQIDICLRDAFTTLWDVMSYIYS